jgi:hypothetical protein
MRIEVPYTRTEDMHLPLVPVSIKNLGMIDAVVDSGAKVSIFQIGIAKALKIKIQDGKKVTLQSLSGKITIYEHKIPVKIYGIEFRLKVGFTKKPIVDLNILGRDNFFRIFNITFEDKRKKLIIRR